MHRDTVDDKSKTGIEKALHLISASLKSARYPARKFAIITKQETMLPLLACNFAVPIDVSFVTAVSRKGDT